jgi:hypothetical protein
LTVALDTYPVDDEPLAIFTTNKAGVEDLVSALTVLDIHEDLGFFSHLSDLIIRVPFPFLL